MKKKLGIFLSLALTAGIMFTGCGNKQTSAPAESSNTEVVTKIMFTGSSTMAPIISKDGEAFTAKYKSWNKVNEKLPDKPIEVAVSSGGSGTGIKAAVEKTSNFGLVSKEISKEEKSTMTNYKEFKIGMDALTISVNAENPILKIKKGLTKEEIQKIFSGEIGYWSELDKALPHNKIVIVVRDATGGAGEVFAKSIMGKKEISKQAIQAASMGALGQKIAENKDAIGYASVGIVDQNKGKIVAMDVDGVTPTGENILSEKYKVARPLLIIKNGELSGTEKAFIDYVTSEEGLKVVKDLGFVPVKNEK